MTSTLLGFPWPLCPLSPVREPSLTQRLHEPGHHHEHLFRRCDLPHVSCGVPTYLRHSQRPGAVSLLSAAAPFCHPREYVCQWALERVKGVTFGCPGCIEKSWAEKELGREVIVVETRSGARLQLFETLILDANVSTYRCIHSCRTT